jgi:type I restriction enzyme M protein
MLNSETKRHIDAARDVLVGVAPNPTTQIDQITYALIYKFMDDMDQAAIKAGGNPSFFIGDLEPYAWSKLSNSRMGNQEKMNLYSEALTKFSEAKQLPELFRIIFKAAFLPYRSPETLGLFLKEISYFDYSHPEELGNAYEYLLSIMSSQGDAGQFRTPRHIIDFIVEVINPTKDDKILDPSCGTAGFLVSAYNHILEQHDGKEDPNKKEKHLTPDERKKLMQNLQGYDIDPTMVRIAQVNMFLHQFKNPQIFQYDSLTSEERWTEKFDMILANPPFMTPKGGIKPHSKFGIKANRSEVLFVDYILNHLKPNGKAGIVVPEGIIFQVGNAYKELRKNLIENGLFAIVSLPSGVFQPYSGVKTSILFIDKKESVKLDEILFVNLNQLGISLGASNKVIEENDLPLAISSIRNFVNRKLLIPDKNIFTVNKLVIQKNEFKLSSSLYVPVNKEIGDIPWKKLSEVCNLVKGKSSSTKTEPGPFPLVLTAKSNKTSVNFDFNGEGVAVPLISSTGHGKADISRVHFVEGKFALADLLAFVQPFSPNILNAKFLYYLLENRKKELALLMRGSANVSMKVSDLENFTIPVPPIEVQEQIVAELESYSAIISGAQQIVDNWKPSIPKEPTWETKKIEELCTIGDGNHSSKYPKSSEMLDKGVRFIRSLNINNGELNDKDLIYISLEKHKELKKGHLCENDVLVTNRGEIGKVAIVSKDFAGANLNSQIAWLRPKEGLNSFFLLYSLLSPELQAKFKQLTQGSTLQQLTIKQLSQIEIPFPDLSTQEILVKQISEEKESINLSKNLIKLFESRTQAKIAKLWNQ